MEYDGICNHTNCTTAAANESVYQTVSEMDWERGIWNAAFSGELVRVQQLLERAREPRALLAARDSFGYTALHYAARGGHAALCAALAARGAELDARTAGRATPLHKAAAAGSVETVKCLLERGARPELQDADGKTALHKVAEQQNYNCALFDMLLEACPELLHVKDNKGNSVTKKH